MLNAAIILFCLILFFVVIVFLYVQLQKQKQKQFEIENNFLVSTKELEKQHLVVSEMYRIKNDENQQLKNELSKLIQEFTDKSMDFTRVVAEKDALLEKNNIQKTEIESMQKRLIAEFENIASKIMKERSDEFALSNQKNLGEILQPLRERIYLFEKKVEETYDKELRDRISLKEEVRKLTELNTRVSEEANNLTKALKGDVKKQGNWGEVVLERVLERSGLTRGQEYEREVVLDGADASVQRPDVIVQLPDNKHVVIDSKVSLVAYERYVSVEDEAQRLVFLKEHITSLRNHVKLLSEKNYQNATNLNTPDFVLMFIPVEASFSAAVQSDSEIFSFAWERKIVIVSPTTLLATLRTIASIWKQENQTKNAQEIARLSGTMYDKFIGFTEDMLKIKTNIDRSAAAYDDAVKKMKDGAGNIIRTAEKIKELGAKTGNKSLPSSFES